MSSRPLPNQFPIIQEDNVKPMKLPTLTNLFIWAPSGPEQIKTASTNIITALSKVSRGASLAEPNKMDLLCGAKTYYRWLKLWNIRTGGSRTNTGDGQSSLVN
jgi:hypothetical protein